MPVVNYVAVLVAGLASFAVGGLWYSPLMFLKPWMAENQMGMPGVKKNATPVSQLYATAFVTSLMASYAMAAILITVTHHSPMSGLKRGFAAGLFWVAGAFASSNAFEGKSLRHWAINAGFYVVQFTVMGLIIGAMNN